MLQMLRPTHQARGTLLAEVRDGLARRQRELPPRLLADAGAAAMRREVDAADAERLARVEGPPLADAVRAVVAHTAQHATPAPRAVVEIAPRAGGTQRLLDALGTAGVAADVATDPPNATRLAADLTLAVPIAATTPRPRLLAALGNALGAYGTLGAVRVLRALRVAMEPHDVLLLGVDTRADAEAVERDLHEALAARTALHRHALVVLRRDLEADVRPDQFEYVVRFEQEARRASLLLVARAATRLALPGDEPIALRRGDTLRTGVYATFDRRRLGAMLAGVGLEAASWHGADDAYAAVVARPTRSVAEDAP